MEVKARALDRSLLHGVAWTAAAKWASQALSWVSWLIVARLLTPEDYGLVGMAAIYLGLITLLSEFGLGTAVLAVRELSVEQINQLTAWRCSSGSPASWYPASRHFRWGGSSTRHNCRSSWWP